MTSPENDYLGTKVQNETLVDRLTTRAMVRRCSINRKSYKDRKPDNIADLLEEAASVLVQYEKEIEELKEDMKFIERAAVHHGSRKMGGLTPKQALSMIQHYPSIVEITESYNEGEIDADNRSN